MTDVAFGVPTVLRAIWAAAGDSMQITMSPRSLISSYALFLGVCVFAGAIVDVAYYRYFDPSLRHPLIVCQNPDHHFGKLAGGKSVPYEFVVRNDGSGPLEISDVRPSCGGCLKIIKFPKEPIAPGEAAVIQVALLTDHLNGLVQRTAAVFSNDLKHRALLLKLHAFVDNPAWAKEMAARAAKKAQKGTVASAAQTVSTTESHHAAPENRDNRK